MRPVFIAIIFSLYLSGCTYRYIVPRELKQEECHSVCTIMGHQFLEIDKEKQSCFCKTLE